jgi:NTE family protein
MLFWAKSHIEILKKSILISTLCFLQLNAYSQYTNLALEGGGMKGLAYSGAFEVLDSIGITQHIERVAGTSSGAMNGMLISIGYSGKEITHLNLTKNFGKYSQVGIPILSGLIRFYRTYGYYKTDRFMVDLAQAMRYKGISPDITFIELHKLRSSNPKIKDLYITGANLTDQKLEVFSHRTYPNMKIIDAVKISISIPLYYEAIFMQPNGEIIDKKNADQNTKVMTDGGVIDNYPFHVFDSLVYLNDGQNSYYLCNEKTLGLKLESDSSQKSMANHVISNQKDFFGAFSHLSSETLNRRHLGKQQFDQTIFINTQGFNPKIRRLNEKKKREIIRYGYQSTLRFFEEEH